MDINQIITRIKARPNDIDIYKGAAESTLRWFEVQMSVTLPEYFKEFYRFSDEFESVEEVVGILPLGEILANRREKHRSKLPAKCFYFAEYLQYCDMWNVGIDERQQAGYSIFCPTGNDENIVLTHSLAAFLKCFLDNGLFGKKGLCDWGDAVAGNDITF